MKLLSRFYLQVERERETNIELVFYYKILFRKIMNFINLKDILQQLKIISILIKKCYNRNVLFLIYQLHDVEQTCFATF